ncbi:MAG: hypothetical protein PVJ55_12200 [Anaerolineae bacterium]|jgi:hypothetical protein
MTDVVQWLLASEEPWTRYRTSLDLLDRPEDDPEVRAARQAMVTHPHVQGLIEEVATWPGYPLKRHNDAKHPFNKLPVLADFGVRAEDPGLEAVVGRMLEQQHPDGPFQLVVEIAEAYGGTGEPTLGWALCDATVNLFSLAALGLAEHPAVQRAAGHLVGLVREPGPGRRPPGGWPCATGTGFRGPGRKDDPCPVSNLHALRALDAIGWHDHPAAALGAEMLLTNWDRQAERKMYLFGIGTTFRRLKYPFVWYDILHVADVLSRFRFVRGDPRFQEVVETITGQADEQGRYTAGSMYRAWKGWSFADKKRPSPWLTFLVLRIQHRLEKDGPPTGRTQ